MSAKEASEQSKRENHKRTKQKKLKSKKCIEKGKTKLGILQIFYATSMINGQSTCATLTVKHSFMYIQLLIYYSQVFILLIIKLQSRKDCRYVFV